MDKHSSAGTDAVSKGEITKILRDKIKVVGHGSWEGSYHHVAGIDDAASALLAVLNQPQGVRTPAFEAMISNLVELDKQRTPGPWRKAHDSVVGGYDNRDEQRRVRLIARCDAEWSGFGLDLANAPKN